MSSEPCNAGQDAAPEAVVLPKSSDDLKEWIVSYYTATAMDYKAWSPGFNMHFGYWRKGMNPFQREKMLNELNLQVLERMGLPKDRPARIVDLGGGTGATARAAVAHLKNITVDVVTIVPRQVEIGREMNRTAPRGEAITMHCADFIGTNLPAGEYDAVCMIESACHAEGNTKAAVLREAHRLLKPGGTLIMVDAMLLKAIPDRGLISRLMRSIYDRWCIAWAVPEMCRADLLPDELANIGFEPPVIDNWSWNVAPSVAHVPIFAAYFALIEIAKAKGKLPLWRWRHIVASFLTPLIGLRRCTFTYCAVISKKL